MAKRKKLWIQRAVKKPGRFTAWCKRNGFSGPTMACIAKAKKSKSASVRGMANFAARAKKGF